VPWREVNTPVPGLVHRSSRRPRGSNWAPCAVGVACLAASRFAHLHRGPWRRWTGHRAGAAPSKLRSGAHCFRRVARLPGRADRARRKGCAAQWCWATPRGRASELRAFRRSSPVRRDLDLVDFAFPISHFSQPREPGQIRWVISGAIAPGSATGFEGGGRSRPRALPSSRGEGPAGPRNTQPMQSWRIVCQGLVQTPLPKTSAAAFSKSRVSPQRGRRGRPHSWNALSRSAPALSEHRVADDHLPCVLMWTRRGPSDPKPAQPRGGFRRTSFLRISGRCIRRPSSPPLTGQTAAFSRWRRGQHWQRLLCQE